MLTSTHEGERANTAAMASKMLRDAGMTWDDVIMGRPVIVQAAWAAAPRP